MIFNINYIHLFDLYLIIRYVKQFPMKCLSAQGHVLTCVMFDNCNNQFIIYYDVEYTFYYME